MPDFLLINPNNMNIFNQWGGGEYKRIIILGSHSITKFENPYHKVLNEYMQHEFTQHIVLKEPNPCTRYTMHFTQVRNCLLEYLISASLQYLRTTTDNVHSPKILSP